MDKEEQLWNQYGGLQDEIRKAGESNIQILGVVAAAVTAILAAGISQTDATAQFFTFLCIYIVTASGYRLIEGNRRRTWRISTYIQVFIESELAYVKWETRLDQQRAMAERLQAGMRSHPPSGYSRSHSHAALGGAHRWPQVLTDQRQVFSSLASTNEAIIIIGLNWITGIATCISFVFFSGSGLGAKGVVAVALFLWNGFLTWRIRRKEKNLRRHERFERESRRAWEKLSLIELSREQGWLSCSRVRQARPVFQTAADEYISALFEELTTAGLGELKDSGGWQKWRATTAD